MRTPNQRRFNAAACVAALALFAASAISAGAPPEDRLPGSDLGLNTVVADSDVIETAKFLKFGMIMSSAAQYCWGIHIEPSALHKGAAKSAVSDDLSMVMLFSEARPVEGQDYLFFLRGRGIIKVLPKSEANLAAVAAMSKRVESLGSHDGGLLGGKISLDEAVTRADTVKTVVFDSLSPGSPSGDDRTTLKVVASPFGPFFKGKWVDMESRLPKTYRLSNPAREGIPGVGEQYIVFIKDQAIFKVVWRTRANYDAVDKLVTRHQSD